MAWLSRSRPTVATRTGTSSADVGHRRAGIVGDHQDLRAARPLGELAGELRARRDRSDGGGGRLDRLDGLAMRPRSVASLATTRAVSPAATTLTRPSDGTCAICSRATRLAAVRRSGNTSIADMRRRRVDHQDQVAREARRVLGERPRDEEGEDHRQEQLEQQQQRAAEPLPRRVGLHVAHQLLPQVRAADGPLGPAQAEHVERDDDRHAAAAR